jgi:hypothetical protein
MKVLLVQERTVPTGRRSHQPHGIKKVNNGGFPRYVLNQLKKIKA